MNEWMDDVPPQTGGAHSEDGRSQRCWSHGLKGYRWCVVDDDVVVDVDNVVVDVDDVVVSVFLCCFQKP